MPEAARDRRRAFTGWRRRPAEAVAVAAAGGQMSVGQVLAAAGEVSDLLRREAAGGRLCVVLPTGAPAAFLVGLVACGQAGVTVVPWREGAQPLEAVVDAVRPDAILRIDEAAPHQAQLRPAPGLAFGGERIGELIVMTSGSTGAPKGVALDFAQVLLNAVAAGVAMDVGRCDAWAIDLDMGLMSAIAHMSMAWQHDLPLRHLAGLDDGRFIQAFREEGVGFGGSPLQLLRLCDKLPPDVAPMMMASSGDFLTTAMVDALVARFPRSLIHKLYGLTELGGRFCCMPHDRLLADRSAAGYPLPGFSVRLADRDPHDGVGEIEARTPLLSAGHYRSPGVFEARESGWFRTGDLGRIDDEGLVTLVGRTDDVIKVGGEKVDRHSVEQALAQVLPGREFCVLGVAHPLIGQCLALFVETSAAGPPPPSWRDLVAHLRGRLPSRFTPGLMYRLEGGLPRLASGKIDRERLKSTHHQFARLA